MAKPKILIVEDEWIIAKDLKTSVKNLGYSVPFVAATGREAVTYVKSRQPDLVLMDIVLQGDMDGIDAAKEIISRFDIPIIYHTAYTDEAILKQAKKSGAYGYLVKPFKERELQAAIEMALYKHQMEKKLRESENRLFTTLSSINDAVISTDTAGSINFMNPLAKSLTGWSPGQTKKSKLQDIFEIQEENRSHTTGYPVSRIIQEGLTLTQAKYSMRAAAGPDKSIELSSAPIMDDKGDRNGVVIVFRDITRRIQIENALEEYHKQLRERAGELLEANENLKVEVSVRKQAEKKLLDYQKQLQSLSSQLSLIEENEKRRIATELHDCIGQTLALSKIKLGLLKKSAPTPDLKKNIREILNLIEQTIKETRTLTFELSPPILYELGLGQAIKWLIDQFKEKHGLNIKLIDDGEDKPFSHNTRFFLFQAIRELLVNVVKHAQASNATIELKKDNGNLLITLRDDGVGFTKPTVNYDGYGLFNIRERMNHIKGTFEIKSVPGRGTRVTLVAPMMPDHKLTGRR